jgi:hypothetical protein
MADDLFSLERDLREVGAEANKRISQATEVTARNIKDDWRQGAEHTGLEGYAASIDYEMDYSGDSIGAKIGPNLGGQGSLGIVEDAPGDVRSAPQHAGRDAARANEDDYARGIEIAVTGAVEDKIGR